MAVPLLSICRCPMAESTTFPFPETLPIFFKLTNKGKSTRARRKLSQTNIQSHVIELAVPGNSRLLQNKRFHLDFCGEILKESLSPHSSPTGQPDVSLPDVSETLLTARGGCRTQSKLYSEAIMPLQRFRSSSSSV